MDIKILNPGDKVLVECTVQAVFANSKMVMVTTRDCTEGFDAYIDEIQEPKTGHWIDIMVGDMPAQACDQCNTFYPLSYTGGGHNYCPNCGAKMESEDKE